LLSRPIDLFRLGKGKKNLLYVGAHHGSEWITANLLYRFLWEAADSLQKQGRFGDVEGHLFLKTHSLFVLPLLNPDGCELAVTGKPQPPLEDRQRRMAADGGFVHWQANARGVDLNHNYDAGFADYRILAEKAGIEPGPTRYGGTHPESEPETHALCGFLRTVPPIAILTLHTQGEVIYASPAGSPYVQRLASRMANLLHYDTARPEGLAAYGGLSDYAGGRLGIPSFTLEIGKGVSPLPITDFPHLRHTVFPLLYRFPVWL